MRIRTRVRKYKKPLKAAPTPRVMLGVGALLGALIVWVVHSDAPAQRGAVAAEDVAVARLAAGESAAAGQPQRLAYRYSVIPGGVHSRSELAGAVLRDPVVAAHYAKFDVTQARVVRLGAPQWMHVSYRVGEKIFWTSKKVMLAAGETIITDGKTTARTRCGNLLSAAPVAPVMMANEPAPEVLDTMYASADGLSDAAAIVPVGQGPAPRPLDMPPVQTAAVSGRVEAPAPAGFTPTLAAPPAIDAVRSAPPTVLHGEIATPPAPPPTNPPAPQDPQPPTNPPAPQNPQPPSNPPASPPQQDPLPPSNPPASPPPRDPPGTPPAPPKNVVPPRVPTPVPEPGTASLMAGALVAIFLLRRKKRDQAGRT
ncbi:PEP-CTERM sorting domain-containing protein [Massilia sp. R2A-15]|uniref:PEP-CTERM sorting domain-containing protein n=1 Tax=Massilia sp. R2A-15 TaxID=3064278 RepID=UPI002732D25F|nr:PEP-CTERM sorting domain-containing protein [Massilia sp. R2A-15]WLI88572.1 PEP-CTERM sorting domain-containing protein [Massilia sp. R2A-15]